MNEVQIFSNEQFGNVRTVFQDGEIWFVAADVCRALEIVNNRDALDRLDPDEKGVALTDTPGGRQKMATINESGLYSLVLCSRKPEARAFKRWVTHDVLPRIRRTGAYFRGSPQAYSCIADIRAALDCIGAEVRRLCAELPSVDPGHRRIAAARGSGRPVSPDMFAGRCAALLDHAKLAALLCDYLDATERTVDSLAAELGVDRRSVYRWKGGYAVPKPPVLKDLVALLECTLEDLMF